MQKRSIVGALLACLIFTPLHAEAPSTETTHQKTFVAVLWPMFGPAAAVGLVELVGEIKMMPNVRVETYVHQAWPSLVDDLNALPPGTRSIVIGYSLGANSTAEVANRVHHVDEFIALQPSMLSWNPDIKGGSYDRFVEIYNPNTWETWGGMGSKKLVGPNIEYIANSDSHPGAQFSSQFRDLVKRDVARLSTDDRVEIAQAAPAPQPVQAEPPPEQLAQLAANETAPATPAVAVPIPRPRPLAIRIASNETKAAPVESSNAPRQADAFVDAVPSRHPDDLTAFIDGLSRSVNSGDLAMEPPPLTTAALMDYARRTYRLGPGTSTLASNAF